MDKQTENNAPEKVPLVKKLILPVSILVVGVVVVVVLYKFLVSDSQTPVSLGSFLSNNPNDAQPQDTFQAPAEVSAAVQMDCQASLEKINMLDSCVDQASEFYTKAVTCLSYDFSIEKPKHIPAEGKFGDVVFAIAACLQKQTADGPTQAMSLLQKTRDLPPWELTFGTATCSSKSVLNAYIKLYSSTAPFVCRKADTLPQLVSDLNKGQLAVLDELISKEHIPQLGQLETDADVTCPESIDNIKTVISKALADKALIIKNEDEKIQDTSSVYLDFAKANNHRALVKLNYDTNGCLYLDSLLASSLDKSEEE